MSTAHQRNMGYKQRMERTRSMGEAKALLSEARKALPDAAYMKVKRVFDKLSFGKEEAM